MKIKIKVIDGFIQSIQCPDTDMEFEVKTSYSCDDDDPEVEIWKGEEISYGFFKK